MRTVKEHILHLMKEETYRPLEKNELLKIFAQSKSERKIIGDVLAEMEESGLIYRTKKDKYGLPEKMNLYVGELNIHPRGFGFLEMQREGEKDIFIPAHAMNGAMNGDRVIVRKVRSETVHSKVEGEIIKITQRAVRSVVGIYESSKSFGFVVPDDRKIMEDIFISKKYASGAKSGDVVVCKIIEYPQKGRNAEGKITEILGKKGEKGVNVRSIIKQRKLSERFSSKVFAEADRIEFAIPSGEVKRRLDLREEITYTIDGSDSKDFDDAISIRKTEQGNYLLGVHIADVSYYVPEGSTLDKEALTRGTSVYLVDQVIPMLPEKLSNGVCSLNPSEDRLTLSCLMEVDPKGNLVRHEIRESIIHSKARLVYEDVSEMLEHEDPGRMKHQPEVANSLFLAKELAEILSEKRKRRGAIDFDFSESKILMDEQGEVVSVGRYERRVANRMIEEFMLLANEVVAEQFYWAQIPFIYRVHEAPDSERLSDFSKFIATFGYHLKGDPEHLHPKELQKLLGEIKGRQEEPVIAKMMLRSMRQARYAPNCIGHFGLAAKYYCHFTSPIRRYPDLQIHRIIKETISERMDSNKIRHFEHVVENVAQQSSIAERNADEAQRQVQDLRKAEYMKKHIGESYEGRISSLTSFGIFVTLENTVEGLIRLHELSDDYYIFDAEHYRLVGEHTKKIFSIGDKAKIRVERVNTELREINFSLL